MRIGNTSVKATGMAAIIFWLILLPEYHSGSTLMLMILSLIPIFLSCLFATVFTVFPFFWFFEGQLSNTQIFKTYFPYYSILLFGVCCFAIHLFNYEVFAISYFTAAFFTLLQTWVWNSKNRADEKI